MRNSLGFQEEYPVIQIKFSNNAWTLPISHFFFNYIPYLVQHNNVICIGVRMTWVLTFRHTFKFLHVLAIKATFPGNLILDFCKKNT